jgi:predicted nucleic acid-binding protein
MNSTNDKYFVDTNILVYAHDASAGAKHERARILVADLWNSSQGVLSTQVLQELCISLRHKAARPLSTDETRRLVQDYLSWEVVVNTPESVIRALDIEGRYGISFWDALIICAAEAAAASVLYTEDFASGQTYASVRAVNPFTVPSS